MMIVDCSAYGFGTDIKSKEEHRINYGRLYPGKTFKADCTCGWSREGERQDVIVEVRKHENLFCQS